jgi:hypothetical protein
MLYAHYAAFFNKICIITCQKKKVSVYACMLRVWVGKSVNLFIDIACFNISMYFLGCSLVTSFMSIGLFGWAYFHLERESYQKKKKISS